MAGLDVVHLIEEQLKGSADERTRAPWAEALGKIQQITVRGGDLVDGAQKLLQDYRADNYLARTQAVLTYLGDVDPMKLADEDLIARAKQAWRTIETTQDAVELQIASVQIPLFSQTFYFADVLNAFLQKPSAFRRTLDVAGALVKALATDIAGTTVPFLGTLMTVFDLMEPRIDRMTKELRNAVAVYDRLYMFHDQLTEVFGYEGFVEESTRLADQSLEIVRSSFVRDAAWLSDVFKDAQAT